jgi:predicted DNA binding CopG/RHH family protein
MSSGKGHKAPPFSSEDEERAFWAREDSVDHIDWAKGEEVPMPRLRPSVRSISLRLPESLLERIKALANKRDVPYQSLMKLYLSERVQRELTPSPRSGARPHRHSRAKAKRAPAATGRQQ